MHSELLARLEAATGADEMSTAVLVAYLREYGDEMHQIAAARLEAYEYVIVTSLRAKGDA